MRVSPFPKRALRRLKGSRRTVEFGRGSAYRLLSGSIEVGDDVRGLVDSLERNPVPYAHSMTPTVRLAEAAPAMARVALAFSLRSPTSFAQIPTFYGRHISGHRGEQRTETWRMVCPTGVRGMDGSDC